MVKLASRMLRITEFETRCLMPYGLAALIMFGGLFDWVWLSAVAGAVFICGMAWFALVGFLEFARHG